MGFPNIGVIPKHACRRRRGGKMTHRSSLTPLGPFTVPDAHGSREEVQVIEKQIDDLIEAGKQVLDTNFDPIAFSLWKSRAFDCLSTLLGPDHAYTMGFRDYVTEPEKKNILAGGGILVAAKERMAGS
jgi:hypothetical protein